MSTYQERKEILPESFFISHREKIKKAHPINQMSFEYFD